MSIKPILLVEDNPDDELLTVRALKKNHVKNEILVARDGPEALAYLFGAEDGGGPGPISPCLVLLDLKLPKINGIEVLRQIRNDPCTQSIPVVILSSSREERDLIDGHQLGVNSYIRKPVDFPEFIAVIRGLSLRWLTLNESSSG